MHLGLGFSLNPTLKWVVEMAPPHVYIYIHTYRERERERERERRESNIDLYKMTVGQGSALNL
jgi:hypothetical protein